MSERTTTVIECIVCGGEIQANQDLEIGELIICPDCGTELEVVSLDPITLEEAPEVQEDWGE